MSSTQAPRSTSISIREGGKYIINRAHIGPNILTIEVKTLQFCSPKLYVKIPAKYANPGQSGLSVEVKPGGNENVNFELQK